MPLFLTQGHINVHNLHCSVWFFIISTVFVCLFFISLLFHVSSETAVLLWQLHFPTVVSIKILRYLKHVLFINQKRV